MSFGGPDTMIRISEYLTLKISPMIKISLDFNKKIENFFFSPLLTKSQLARLDLFISHQGLEIRCVNLKLFEMFDTVRKVIEI